MRHRPIAALAVIALLAACGGGSARRAETVPTPTTTTTSTTVARATTSIPSVGVTSTTGLAETIETPTSSASTPATSEGPAASGLEGMLLTVTDLPTGFSVAPPSESTDDTTTTKSDECTATGDVPAVKDLPSAEIDFTQSLFGPYLTELIAQAPNHEIVDAILDQVKDIIPKCNGTTETDPSTGEKTTVTFGPLSFPNIGDRTIALHGTSTSVSADGVSMAATFDLVVVQKNAKLIMLMNAGLGPMTMPAADFERVARIATDRVHG